MAAIDDLIQQIQDPVLRERIRAEVDDLAKQKKFGLVFENHLPEHTPLYEAPIKVGSLVMPKLKKGDALFTVKEINGDTATLISKADGTESEAPLRSVVVAAELGEPIYPYLKYVDSVSRAPNDDLWHILIEADNYHALQLLEYMYAGKVDCIYIDPPYNTGARDWKYNNDYVDGNDAYRHSKWLSMMEKRIRLAKKLLNPADSVLIVTIDEKEYLHLGCLLEDVFPNAHIQMVSININPASVARNNEFGRTDEFAFFVMIGSAGPQKIRLSDEWLSSNKGTTKNAQHWNGLLRTGTASNRADRPNMFYPIFVSEDGKRIVSVGSPLPIDVDRTTIVPPEGCISVWPLHSDGTEGRWRYGRDSFVEIQRAGFVRLGKLSKNTVTITYLAEGERKKIETGEYKIIGKDDNGCVVLDDSEYEASYIPGTQWSISTHDASRHGSNLLRKIFGEKVFSFPKSIYATADTIRFFVENKPNALVLDFFAGSGTTLHSVNLLNANDGGSRRCVLVTNNEVSEEEAKSLTAQGFLPGDEDWEQHGIARSVTWPRTRCSILGVDTKGKKLEGNYALSNRALSDGFMTNALFFKLSFLDRSNVAMGKQLNELIPLLWMKAGCFYSCPSSQDVDCNSKKLLFPKNRFAVLIDEAFFDEFEQEVTKNNQIETIFIVTNSEINYKEMALAFEGKATYQLYRDYLDNFRLNVRK